MESLPITTREIVAAIVRLREQGMSRFDIARWLLVPLSFVYRVCREHEREVA